MEFLRKSVRKRYISFRYHVRLGFSKVPIVLFNSAAALCDSFETKPSAIVHQFVLTTKHWAISSRRSAPFIVIPIVCVVCRNFGKIVSSLDWSGSSFSYSQIIPN